MVFVWNLRWLSKHLDFLTPAVAFGLLIYGNWAYIHKFAIKKLFHQHGRLATAVGLIATIGVLDICVLLIWVQVLLVGPGAQKTIEPYTLLPPAQVTDPRAESFTSPQVNKPPLIYQCDENGYPTWCAHCQSVKSLRTHHSGRTGSCVFKFDHYCGWLGTLIGAGNYLLFIQFLVYMDCLLLIMWISMSPFIRVYTFRRDGNLIAIYILSVWCSLFVTGLLTAHIYMISLNLTSLEGIILKKTPKKNAEPKPYYVCYKNPKDHCRYVIKLTGPQFMSIWRKCTIWANWIDQLGERAYLWFVPIYTSKGKSRDIESAFDETGSRINDKILTLIDGKLQSGEYLKRFEAYGDGHDEL
ncbi:palmitoyltransferase PFA5 KNAG_0C02830 [Huiozyma naganishii CBS 8797]|uniref:Palmitoyltransferase n=1 Tax=Huiozyma naganishii (strain ATCC MYA-139 / BCRC 22969 / CBS 8797 / KCTC 17520 / NBRC 10181 / NCYC 3082 / Yp74L-3) TaxID=1071383 RepID=J7S4P0_HUIN7|nr:hypothetical protein KNAG_0C02830 [Kazachstania naganishii CBS 8797]CCK69394.1 hypothetical protein KNAG_0C02830 [Kazachstania naganishii CBS 8797]